MGLSYRYRGRVQFSDTDMAGIVHFSNFFRYLERAEHAMYRALGLSVVDGEAGEGERVGWPRVGVSAEFRRPLRFEDEFVVVLGVEEIRDKTVIYVWEVEDLGGGCCAEGRLTVVCVRKDEAGQMRAVSIPGRWREKLGGEGLVGEGSGEGSGDGEGGERRVD